MAKKKVKSKAKQPSKSSVAQNISSEVIAAAYSPAAQPVFMKVCRLCESKDGPFLNIFDADKVTAKKIDELMPFGITENDDLPHKICFRCSAKLEELYEFIQKCIKTQESLRSSIGKTGPFLTKTKTRKAWEEKLNKTNMSNDDICDALIKKAMEGIKDIPLTSPEKEDSPPPPKRVTRTAQRSETVAFKKESTSEEDEESDKNNKKIVVPPEKVNTKVPPSKPTASKPPKSSNRTSGTPIQPSINKNTPQSEAKPSVVKVKNNSLINNLSFDYEEEKPSSDDEKSVTNEEKSSKKEEKAKEVEAEKPFNIMDHISIIKVNQVGVLFQCKFCNRNFLKKEVVESHNCAKNGIPKQMPKTDPIPEPPRVSTVKYIKLDGDLKKPNSWKSYSYENGHSSSDHNSGITNSNKNMDSNNRIEKEHRPEENVQPVPKVKPKPRIGPASKIRRFETDSNSGSAQNDSDSQQSHSSNVQSPSVHIPSAPNLNGRFKLVPGPNNIFTLVEDTVAPATENQKSGKKRKSDSESELKSKDRKKDYHEKSKSPDDDKPKPYPVGLFQTVARQCEPINVAPPTSFTTPAMKKQSYTIVQTGNPSKLLISTKALAPPVEVPKKRQRKTKPEVREDVEEQEPFRVTLEDVAHPKDTGFFTFINVDPLLQPSYVLPTDNIIQESQISTSTALNAPESSKESKDKDKDKYSCNMCGENFTREKKLLAHIQLHYTKMDEEDLLRAEKGSTKKRSRK
ncbi:nucleolar and coiled-body phosphoprotein 1 [Helicoverpa armigera]|uniref:nucleolar and coiled-body phosphoprotein 1 n=1 Tax=Helicoverpa armigera TaxID=29058 RepID=UPI003082D15D